MKTAANSNKGGSARTSKAGTAPALPAGFEEIGSQLAGWFVREPGNSIEGILRGSFSSKGGEFGPRKVYRVEITAGKTKVSNADDDGVYVTEGIVGLDETGYLKRLGDLADGRHVFVRCLSKGPKREDPWVFQLGAVPF
jgi:hypothetical protein